MILIQLDDNSKKPIYCQIVEKLTDLVDCKTLQPGDRLPSTRELSSQLGVNRSTVYRAYQELWAKGYVDCKSGSYTTIRYRRSIDSSSLPAGGSLIEWDKVSTPAFKGWSNKQDPDTKSIPDENVINFVALSPDPRIYPVELYRKSQMVVMRLKGASLLQYGDPMGYEPLRETISQRSRLHGLRIETNEVLITNGVQQSLNLILQFLTKPGDTVVVEDPTYSSALPVFALHGVNVIGVPMTENGIDLEKLKAVIKKERPAL